MTPKKFKGSNVVFAENQPEYIPLPAFQSEEGVVVSCWNLSFLERLSILFKGELWLSMLTSNKGLTPTYLTTKRSEVL